MTQHVTGQVYNSQGQKENDKSCVKKAELLYKSSRENRTTYTSPHVLLSPLLQFPFSVGYLFLRDNTLPKSTVFVETSLLLLDLYLDIGNCHLHLKNYTAAKKMFLKLCQSNPTTSSWLGAGIAFFRTCEYKHCEIALVEANHIDSKNAKVWAYLTLVCLALDRGEEAEISFQQLQKVELYDVALLLEVADGFAKCGNYRDAEAATMDALKEEEGQVAARFKLGDLNHQQGKLECAKLEYETIMNLEVATCPEKNTAEELYNQVQADIIFASNPVSDRRVTM